MSLLEKDKSWKFLYPELYKVPLVMFFEMVFPKQSHQPLVKDIFNVFDMPLQAINMVIVCAEPSPAFTKSKGYSFIDNTFYIAVTEEYFDKKIDFQSWIDQGVFFLNVSLTGEIANYGSHTSYWKPFILNLVTHLSTMNPCIWLFIDEDSKSILKYITNKFIVKGYDTNTINDIPNSNFNYILDSPVLTGKNKQSFIESDHFHLANKILRKTKNKIINW